MYKGHRNAPQVTHDCSFASMKQERTCGGCRLPPSYKEQASAIPQHKSEKEMCPSIQKHIKAFIKGLNLVVTGRPALSSLCGNCGIGTCGP